jgi:ADP-ribose pyrophosphatase YjhB (NUDIX family)
MFQNHIKVIHNRSNHKIDIEIIDQSLKNYDKIEKRMIVRGIVIKNNQILVVYPKNECIYGTPGGGVDLGESLEDALRREMREEVGAKDIQIIEYLGTMKAYRKSFNEDTIFMPKHHFFLVKIKAYGDQDLMPYEKALDLQYKFMNIDEVIQSNEHSLDKRNLKYADFYSNQTIVLKTIKQLYFNN